MATSTSAYSGNTLLIRTLLNALPQPWSHLSVNDYQIITVNRRLSGLIQQGYDQYCRDHLTAQAWPQLPVQPLADWLRSLHDALATTKQTRLTDFQASTLWQQVIQADMTTDIPATEGTLHAVQQAWQLIQDWQLPHHALTHLANDNTRAWLHWANQFQSICTQQHWLTSAELLTTLTTQIDALRPYLPRYLLLIGFDELRPNLKHYLRQLSTVCNIIHCQPQWPLPSARPARCLITANHDDELRQMAAWAKAYHEAHPHATIACILPTLTQKRAWVERCFIETFAPSNPNARLNHQVKQQLPFNLSAGKPLAHYPLVDTALTLLTLNRHEIPKQTWLQLMRSPYWLLDQPALLDQTLQLMDRLQQDPHATLPLDIVLQQAQALGLQPLVKAAQAGTQHPHPKTTHSPSNGVKHIRDCLSQWGWPGQRMLDSHDYQVCQRWLACLDELAQLDTLQPAVTWPQLLALLKQLSHQTVFQPQKPHTPIQILGLLETAGQLFEAAWLTDMDAEHWPPAPAPNPFIPLTVQHQYQLPHSSAKREYHYAQTLTQGLKQRCGQLIASYGQVADGIAVTPSPLVQAWDIEIAQYDVQPAASSQQLEDYVDDQGPPLITDQVLKGGVAVLKDQALCPFKAFVRHRLHAIPRPAIKYGLSKQDMGILLHEILAAFWTQVQDHHTLSCLSQSARSQRLFVLIDTALQSAQQRPRWCLTPISITLARQQLHDLLMVWLDEEQARPPFTVKATEQRQVINIAGLTLRVTLDRLDELDEDHSLWLLDYKSGQTTTQYWQPHQFFEPQLPLYGVHLAQQHQPIRGIILAQLHWPTPKLTGWIDETMTLTDYPQAKRLQIQPWQRTLSDWSTELTELAQAVQRGDAAVMPADPTISCQYCHYHRICRIQERQA